MSAASAAELVVDSSCLVAFGAEYVQTADFRHAGAKFNVRASACHICCDSHIAPHSAVAPFVLMAGLGYNGGFSFMVFGVEQLVVEPVSFLEGF